MDTRPWNAPLTEFNLTRYWIVTDQH